MPELLLLPAVLSLLHDGDVRIPKYVLFMFLRFLSGKVHTRRSMSYLIDDPFLSLALLIDLSLFGGFNFVTTVDILSHDVRVGLTTEEESLAVGLGHVFLEVLIKLLLWEVFILLQRIQVCDFVLGSVGL